MLVINFVFVISLVLCDGYKILLMFPFPGRSHAILGEGYVRHLLEAGHDITYITPMPMKSQHPRLRQIDVYENYKFLPPDTFSIDNIIEKEEDILDYIYVIKFLDVFWNNTLHMESIQSLLHDENEQFDAVVVEWLYIEMGAGIASVFNCPLIWSSSMMPHTFVISLIDEHLNPSYTFYLHSQQRSYTFMERTRQLWTVLRIRYYFWSHMDDYEKMYKSIYESALAKRGRILPNYNDVRYNASLMLGNGNIITSDTISLPKNYRDIGGYHIKRDREPLPQNLQKIMDEATNGVIYFSLGSILKISSMNDEYKKIFLEILSNTNRTVIWNSDTILPNLPKNFHIVNWVPQQTVLAHPNCILFITHAGLLSITESIYFGVPVIGLPFFADQYNNINKAFEQGFGKPFDIATKSPWELKGVITEVLENPSYRRRAKEVSAIYHDQLSPPSEELVFWISHVIRTGGAPHLRSTTLKLEWYKKLYLDLVAVILIAIISIFIGIKYYLRIPKNERKKKID